MKNTTIHPKTGGAAIGGALATLLVAIANSIHGVHLPPEVTAAIGATLPILGAYLTPSQAPAPAPAPAAAAQPFLGGPAGLVYGAPAPEQPPAAASAYSAGWPADPAPAAASETIPELEGN